MAEVCRCTLCRQRKAITEAMVWLDRAEFAAQAAMQGLLLVADEPLTLIQHAQTILREVVITIPPEKDTTP